MQKDKCHQKSTINWHQTNSRFKQKTETEFAFGFFYEKLLTNVSFIINIFLRIAS